MKLTEEEELRNVRLMQINFYGNTFETLLKEFCPDNAFRRIAIHQAKQAIENAKRSVEAGESKSNARDKRTTKIKQ